jgi:hypothetical protein
LENWKKLLEEANGELGERIGSLFFFKKRRRKERKAGRKRCE